MSFKIENIKLICKFLGGSHMYGLSTPESDEDVRGVFLHTDMSYIVGLNRYEHYEKITDGDDIKYKEFRALVGLLRKGNTEAIEMLFLEEEKFEVLDPKIKLLRDNANSLVDPHKLFKTLCGYMQGERRLALGERTGRLGSKRKNSLDEYGYSPKNVVQLLRLAWCGGFYFKNAIFPTHIPSYDEDFAGYLLDIKTKPEKYSVQDITLLIDEADENIKSAYDNDLVEVSTFSEDFANEAIFKAYESAFINKSMELMKYE